MFRCRDMVKVFFLSFSGKAGDWMGGPPQVGMLLLAVIVCICWETVAVDSPKGMNV